MKLRKSFSLKKGSYVSGRGTLMMISEVSGVEEWIFFKGLLEDQIFVIKLPVKEGMQVQMVRDHLNVSF
jgi:hypothetical protein